MDRYAEVTRKTGETDIVVKARPGRKRRVRYLDRRAVFRPHAQRFWPPWSVRSDGARGGRRGGRCAPHRRGHGYCAGRGVLPGAGRQGGHYALCRRGDRHGRDACDGCCLFQGARAGLLRAARAADAWAASIPSWPSRFFLCARHSSLHVRELAGGNSHHIIEGRNWVNRPHDARHALGAGSPRAEASRHQGFTVTAQG